MCTYFDVRFKHPWSFRGYARQDRVAFHQLVGYKHFCIGVNPDHSFSFLRIYDEGGRVRQESELGNIDYAGLEALILWRLSTPLSVLDSMAAVCLGSSTGRTPEVPVVHRQPVTDPEFVVALDRLPLEEFSGPSCLMLIEQRPSRDNTDPPIRRELLIYRLPGPTAP
jgi:hypothetical protein